MFVHMANLETVKPVPAHLLPVIIFAQFAGTSLWFAGNAVAGDLIQAFQLAPQAIGDLTAAVQLGFIAGTFVFAILAIADRFSPSKVFLWSAVAGAGANLILVLLADNLSSLLLFRFVTGFFLAGIYPVGMKISADWHQKGLGKALGYLVGALVLGTAFPHLIKAVAGSMPWRQILLLVSLLTTFGGVLLYITVPDGPYRKKASRFDWRAIPHIFSFPRFRAAAFGYFGHMWELYAFWAFVPVILRDYQTQAGADSLSIPMWSFIVIGIGAMGCIVGGYLSIKAGSGRIAFVMLLVSGICCLLSPLLFYLPAWLFVCFLLVWGFSVVADSPQFSSVVAQAAPADYTGTALTIVNSIGFAITILSIQLLNHSSLFSDPNWRFLLLLPGPIIGLIAMRKIVFAHKG